MTFTSKIVMFRLLFVIVLSLPLQGCLTSIMWQKAWQKRLYYPVIIGNGRHSIQKSDYRYEDKIYLIVEYHAGVFWPFEDLKYHFAIPVDYPAHTGPEPFYYKGTERCVSKIIKNMDVGEYQRIKNYRFDKSFYRLGKSFLRSYYNIIFKDHDKYFTWSNTSCYGIYLREPSSH